MISSFIFELPSFLMSVDKMDILLLFYPSASEVLVQSSAHSIFHSILFAVVFCKHIFSNTSIIKAKKIPRSSTATKETILLNEIGVSAFDESHPID